MKKLFFICAPNDYPWTRSLAHQFFSMGYRVYLEPPDIEEAEAVQERTARALYNADIMVAIISKESAIGSSAEAFEAWWRPFIDSGRQVIACITPDSPAGAENWMPYDLIRRPHVDFRRVGATARLVELVNKDVPAPVRPVSRSTPDETYETEFEADSIAYPTQPVSPITEPEPEPKVSSIGTVIGLAVGLVLVLIIWQAALQSDNSQALLWLGGLVIIVMVVYWIGRWRRKAARKSTLKPVGYLEVIASPTNKDKGRVYGLIQTLTIGTGRRVQIRLKVEGIEKRHCTISYDGKAYYLENTSKSRTILYDRQLDEGEVVVLQHGDLITVGQAAILQFRTQL